MTENNQEPLFPGIVTTPRGRRDLDAKAQVAAEQLGVPFAPRAGLSAEKLFEKYNVNAIWVERDDAPAVVTRRGRIAYCESTAALRARAGAAPDPLARAADVRPGDRILDATLGMAVDALVLASHLDKGHLLGLEASPLLAALVARGLREYEFKSKHLQAAAKHITVKNESHETFLENCEPDSFDIVYFDPLFEKTIESSSTMQRLRGLAMETPFTPDTIAKAQRAAKRAVIVKCRRGCFMDDIEFDEFMSAGRTIGYGIIRK
jgi:16S rRNA (guanine1516-N2)-methyltransferase